MATDIQLDAGDGSVVVVDSRVLKTTASDFMLDAPGRRARNDRGAHGLRRALVHDQRDGLTINFNRDYPGGVTINDVVEMNNRFGGIKLSDVLEISPYGTAHPHAQGPAPAKRLVLRGDIRIQRDPAIDAGTNATAETDAVAGADDMVSLQALLNEMQAEIVRLHEKVTRLERDAR